MRDIYRKRRQVIFLVVLLLILCIAFVEKVGAENYVARKLSRGLANLSTGWLEIGKSIEDTSDIDGPVAASSKGLVVGLGRTVGRLFVGVYEVTTSLLPINKDPIMEPEYLVYEPIRAEEDKIGFLEE